MKKWIGGNQKERKIVSQYVPDKVICSGVIVVKANPKLRSHE